MRGFAKIFLCLLLNAELAASGASAGDAPFVNGEVNAERLNVRVRPGTSHSSVALLKRGDIVEVKGVDGAWLEIALPKDAEAWVAESFLKDGTVLKTANLRAGPGVAYEPVGVVEPGVKLEVVDSSSKDHWVKVSPPDGLSAYVSADYVKVSNGDIAKLKKPGGDVEAPGKEQAPNLQKSSSQTPFADGDGRNVAVEGMLLPLANNYPFATHALAAEVAGEYHPLCYLHSSSFNLKLWEGRKVRVKGSQRWIETWTRPLVEVESVTPAWQ